MRTTISARHCEISEELRERAVSVLQRLTALVDRPVDGTVVFDVAPQTASAEIRIHSSAGELFLASGEDKDHRSALDRAEDKVRRQLERSAGSKRGRSAKDAV
jgi:ribosomal subunit interface protein